MINLRKFLFSYRSFTPLPLVIALLYFASPALPFVYFGVAMALIGESIRINAVRYTGGATRTTKVGAPSLCTSGPYARTRNPLYLGNMIIYCGMALIAGGPFMWEILLVVFAFFTFQYSLIIALEEETLVNLFGADYETYRGHVPRLFPRITPWMGSDDRSPAPLIKTLQTEKRTLQSITLILLLITARTYFGSPV